MTAPHSDVVVGEAARMSALRMQMLELHPFWGYLLLQVRLVPALGLPCFAATDCRRHIWYNPLWTRHLSYPQLGFVLAHEVAHHVLASLDRARGRDPHLWNCATDYAINRIVAGMRGPGRNPQPLYAFPDGTYPDLGQVRSLWNPRYDGLTAEAIYEHLAAHAPPTVTVRVQVTLPLDAGGSGSSPTVQDHGGGIDIHLPEGLTPHERDELLDRVKGALEAWRQDGRRGDLPSGLERAVDAQGPGRVPWQRLLARVVGQAVARDDYSFAQPNRRYLQEDLVVPGLYSDAVGEVIVAVDTSGSMSAAQLGVVAAELASLHALVPELTVLVADAKVQQVVRARELPAFLKGLRFRGGGGTSHLPVFEWIRERRLQPELFIGMTDLFTELPTRRPAFPVLWLVPQRHGVAPWGTVVEVA
jgi:predicted metal-dependent peptidase